jgi:hypothetical protein
MKKSSHPQAIKRHMMPNQLPVVNQMRCDVCEWFEQVSLSGLAGSGCGAAGDGLAPAPAFLTIIA